MIVNSTLYIYIFFLFSQVLHGDIDQILMNSLHCLLNFEIGGLDCPVNTRVNILCPLSTHKTVLFCNALDHVTYSVVSGQ